jgi:hypothetical protein
VREEFWGKAMVMKLQKLGYIFIKMNIQTIYASAHQNSSR